MSGWEAVLTIVGLGVITVLTRAFFFIPRRELPIPGWFREGLRYAPLAALAAVVVPEIVMTGGALITTWQDARLFAVAAATKASADSTPNRMLPLQKPPTLQLPLQQKLTLNAKKRRRSIRKE